VLLTEPLTDGILTLRAWRDEDVPAMVEGCSDPAVSRWIFNIPVPYSEADAKQFLATTRAKEEAHAAVERAIDEAASGELAGAIGISQVNLERKMGAIGYWIGPRFRRRGYAVRAVGLLSRWAIEVLGLERIELFTDTENGASQRVAERAGFQREGLLRQFHTGRGERRDDYIYSLLPSDL
jgi:RimJ/RimL family protein N-acetyltransferase